MTDDQLDQAIRGLVNQNHISPELLQKLVVRTGSSLQPVKPLTPAWMLVVMLVCAVFGIAVAGAAMLGLYGFRAMETGVATVLLVSLSAFTTVSAVNCVQLGIPGSPRWLPSWVLLAAEVFLLPVIFAMCFSNYDSDEFVAQGIRCLVAGLAQAVFAASLIVLILRRCFPVDLRSSGLAQGTLAGIAGVLMLNLHCARLQVPHLASWHTSVLPFCAVFGILVAHIVRLRRSSVR